MNLKENSLNKKNDEQKYDELRFEFVFFINDHIICQRFFHVRDYNEDVKDSYELKELMDEIVGFNKGDYGSMGIIPKFLKEKTLTYLWDSYNPYFIQQDENRNIFAKNIDNFQLEIKVDGDVIAKGQFCGNYFPPRVRYEVNIKEIIPSIMSEIRTFLSLKKYKKVVA